MRINIHNTDYISRNVVKHCGDYSYIVSLSFKNIVRKECEGKLYRKAYTNIGTLASIIKHWDKGMFELNDFLSNIVKTIDNEKILNINKNTALAIRYGNINRDFKFGYIISIIAPQIQKETQ